MAYPINGLKKIANGFLPEDIDFSTRAIQTDFTPEKYPSWSVMPPICLTTTYKQPGPNQPVDYVYARGGNPTRQVLENVLAALEKAKHCLTFSSGLAAGVAISQLLNSGDHMLLSSDVYGGVYRMGAQVFPNAGIDITFANFLILKEIEIKLRNNTKVVWIETPSNPLMKYMDIEAIVKLVRAYNKEIIIVVDNTFLTPYFQKPLEFDADLILHSITKYINGHSDIIMGALITNNEQIFQRLKFIQNACGAVSSPFDCFQVLRGVRTLALRMKQHMISSYEVAKFLHQHPYIEEVLHIGLPSHPQHELAKRTTSGWSGVFSFYIKGGLNECKLFLSKCKIFTLAESLGGFESLIEIPSIMTHASIPREEKEKLRITDNLIRISIGLESYEDLINDLKQALQSLYIIHNGI